MSEEQRGDRRASRRPARRESKRKTPELSIQSRPFSARQASQMRRVQGRLRYSEMLVAEEGAGGRGVHHARRGRALGHQATVGTAGRVQPRRIDQEGHGLLAGCRRRRALGRARRAAKRVASAMIVSCGLTPSALGTTEPSATCRPSTPCTARSASTTPRVGARVGAGGAERMEGHQAQVAWRALLGRRPAGSGR